MKRLIVALVAILALAGCSGNYRTIGGPTGDLTLTADFSDVQDLVPGHSVQMGDVKIGSVTRVQLVSGYRAKVTMSIKNGVHIPVGTTAEISVTSLLGENYVKLSLPSGADMSKGPYMADHAAFTQTSVQPAFEQVLGQAGDLIAAVAGNDVGTILDASATALGGNGQNLHDIIAKSASLLQVFADQKTQLATAVQQFATVSKQLADGKDQLAAAPGRLAAATAVLNTNKEKIVTTVANLSSVAQQLNDKVLDGRVNSLHRLLVQLDPVTAKLGDNRQSLTNLVNGLTLFTKELPRATFDGQLLLYPILQLELGNSGKSKSAKAAAKAKASGSSGASGSSSGQSGGQSKLPAWLLKLFPSLGGAQ